MVSDIDSRSRESAPDSAEPFQLGRMWRVDELFASSAGVVIVPGRPMQREEADRLVMVAITAIQRR